MKVWGTSLLPLATLALGSVGCAAVHSPGQVNAMAGEAAPAAVRASTSRPAGAGTALMTPETRSFVDRLRADTDYRPTPTGGQGVTSWVEFAPGAYIAQGWPWYDVCAIPWAPVPSYTPSWMRCEPYPFVLPRPYCPPPPPCPSRPYGQFRTPCPPRYYR